MISVLLFYDSRFDSVAGITLPWWKKYCTRHGYNLTIHRGTFGNRDRNISFQKTEMASSILPGCSLLFVVDLDTLPTNHTIQIERFCEPDFAIMACEDVNGMNAGAYIVNNNEAGRSMLAFATAYARMAPDGHGDQNAIRKWIEYNPEEFCRIPHPAFNSYLYEEYGERKTHDEGQWKKGDFLLHLPGMNNERRVELFTQHIPDIIE